MFQSVATNEVFTPSQLITQDRDTGNGYYLIARHYEAANEAEVVAIRLESGETLKRGGGAKRKNSDKTEMDEATLNKSVARARTHLKRKCLAMCADRMMTLTFKENVSDINDAWNVFKYFTKLMRQRYKDHCYVAVPEYQKRGAVHFHLAIDQFRHANTVRRLWKRAAGKFGGNIDITSPKKFGKNSWNPRRIAQYISKYISKTDSAEFNRRRYSSGGDIQLPEPQRGWIALGISLPAVLDDVLYQTTRKTTAYRWESEGFLGLSFYST